MKKPISIIITAYNSVQYIEECLDSIQSQTYFKDFDDYEILVGIDGCLNTLKRINEIKHKYKNLKVLYMVENKGTYITTNTLLSNIKYENFIRFDSDDVMVIYMVERLMNIIDNYDIVRFKYMDFKKVGYMNYIQRDRVEYSHGVIISKRKVMNLKLGGYKSWKCAADTDLLKRAEQRFKVFKLDDILFYRRIHDNSLTKNNKTGFKSDIRKFYTNEISKGYKKYDIFINREVNDFILMDDELYDNILKKEN